MEKAHLYEALYLVNHGIDEAVRGVQRLKKSPKLFMETYHKSMAGLERRRSMINLQFMLEMRKLEGKPPLVQFLPRSKRPKKTPKKTEGVHPSHRPNGPLPSAAGVKNRTQEDAHE